MKVPRLSIGSVGFAVVICAVDFAVIRAAFGSGSGWEFFALLLLPMLDALLIALYRLRRPSRRTAGSIGFVAAGSLATALLFSACVASPEGVLEVLRVVVRPIVRPIMNGMARLLGNAAMQNPFMQLALGLTFELLIPAAALCLPPLLVALVGGRIAHRFEAGRSIAAMEAKAAGDGVLQGAR